MSRVVTLMKDIWTFHEEFYGDESPGAKLRQFISIKETSERVVEFRSQIHAHKSELKRIVSYRPTYTVAARLKTLGRIDAHLLLCEQEVASMATYVDVFATVLQDYDAWDGAMSARDIDGLLKQVTTLLIDQEIKAEESTFGECL
ncbi:hypothetical protein OF83DRAFT_643002 [Amylostereum chailletii]|nr:hypothetical protein OF83DRAFT_643002 [Amylostereum chailletii]